MYEELQNVIIHDKAHLVTPRDEIHPYCSNRIDIETF